MKKLGFTESRAGAIWTLERCQEEAMKYDSRKDWFNRHKVSYNIAQRRGWIDLCLPIFGNKTERHDGPNKYWTIKRVQRRANLYNRVVDWARLDYLSYRAARRSGWLSQCIRHMEDKTMPKRGGSNKGKRLNRKGRFTFKPNLMPDGVHKNI